MHIKCLRRGTGSARATADYLVGERDAAGHRCEGVEVVRGNPDLVAAVADAAAFEHTYTSVVIAWSPRTAPRCVRYRCPHSSQRPRPYRDYG